MNAPFSINRRHLLQRAGFLALSFAIPFNPARATELPDDLKDTPMLSAWLRINADETVTLMIGKVELGQGNVTAVAQVCADELAIDMARLKIISGDTELVPNEGVTAGSQSMPNCAPAVQQASAEVREILLGLAATKLDQPIDGMKIEDGTITAANGKSVTYWKLLSGKELEREATGAAKLRPISEHRYIGKSIPRLDIPGMMTGAAVFVQDMKPKGTVYGAVSRPPTYGAKLTELDTTDIKKMPGVLKVVRDGSFLGIIAEREEQANAAAAAMGKAAKWKVDKLPTGTEGIFDWLTNAKTDDKEILTNPRSGGPPAKTFKATYMRPYQMHGSIGTSAAIAQLGDDGVVTIHTHSQSVFDTGEAIAELLGIDKKKVHCIHVQGSGCYGHNLADDAAADAALLAVAVPGKPVKLQYTRAQEHEWEPYGSAMVIKTEAGVDAAGNVLDWTLDLWSTSHGTRPNGKAGNLLSGLYLKKPFEQPVPENGGPPNYSADRNAIAFYEFPGQRVVTHFITEMPLRVSSTRSLGAYANIFAIESFMDELAHAAGVDPLEYRLRFLKNERARDVLTKCAEKFGWASYEKKENRGRGIAFGRYKNYAAFVAVAVEVEFSPRNGRIHVVRAVAANDSGHMINPDGIANQIEGGLIQSLSWTLKEEVKFDETGVLSNDWKSYPIMTFTEVPSVDVVLINRPGEPYLGTGEAAQGPTCAAVANAVFDATGARLRRLPFTPDRLKAELENPT
ncbi:MAG TPA: molybdopterin cofactor-binding domain-containing protein [Aestuariivirga sp.]